MAGTGFTGPLGFDIDAFTGTGGMCYEPGLLSPPPVPQSIGVTGVVASGAQPAAKMRDLLVTAVAGPVRAVEEQTITFRATGFNLNDPTAAEKRQINWVVKFTKLKPDTSNGVASQRLVPGEVIQTYLTHGDELIFDVPKDCAGKSSVAMAYRNSPSLNVSAWTRVGSDARTPSGPTWHTKFANSNRTADLSASFKTKWEKFEKALIKAGASVDISSTLRPKERAYLMHYSWRLRHGQLKSHEIPEQAAVAIEWTHSNAHGERDEPASRKAATALNLKYGMAQQASLKSNHIKGDAIDVYIHWSGDLTIEDAKGTKKTIKGEPRHGGKGKKKDGQFGNKDLHAVGKTYGVLKLFSDPPHWSETGR